MVSKQELSMLLAHTGLLRASQTQQTHSLSARQLRQQHAWPHHVVILGAVRVIAVCPVVSRATDV